MKRKIAIVGLVVAAAGSLTSLTGVVPAQAAQATVAKADDGLHQPTYRIEQADRKVKHLRVTYVERLAGRAYVEFNNGSAWNVRPCQVEDVERCWWDGGNVGNHTGRSFVRLHHHTYAVKGI